MQMTEIRVRLLKHKATALLCAVSDDVPGLAIHGRSAGEIESRLPSVLRDLLRASGHNVDHVKIRPDAMNDWSVEPAYIASPSLQPQP
jgi:hypothetical protein